MGKRPLEEKKVPAAVLEYLRLEYPGDFLRFYCKNVGGERVFWCDAYVAYPNSRLKYLLGSSVHASERWFTVALKSRLNRIRNRRYYALYSDLHRKLKATKTAGEQLTLIHEFIDANGLYGSQTKAYYATQSLMTVLKDRE